MTFSELQQHLGLTRGQLRKLIARGLPVRKEGRRKVYDQADVDAWLLDHGFAEEAVSGQPSAVKIARTRAEAARLLGLGLDGERTLARWLNMPGFPGRSGSPGRADGYFPIEEIQQWRAAQGIGGGGGVDGGDEELKDLRKRITKLDLEKKERDRLLDLERLADVDEVAQYCEQQVNNAKALLLAIPDEVLERLPASVSDSLRRQIHDEVTRIVETSLEELALMAQGDQDDVEDVEE